MNQELKNLIDMIVNKGDETVKNISNEIFMSEHFATAVEKIISTKGIVDRKVKTILNTMNVASKIDIDDLNDRIRKLGRDVARLQKTLEELQENLTAREPQQPANE